jgi:hypothetical protein
MRWRNYINLYEMSHGEAANVFRRLGVNPSGLDQRTLRSAYLGLVKAHHPDRGGDAEITKKINAAYDVLKSGDGSTLSDDDFRRAGAARREQEARRRAEEQGDTTWSHAGYSGGMANSSSIYRNDFRDMNYFKKRMWELAGSPRMGPDLQEWTITAYDGAFFRSSLTVYGLPRIFNEMADAMVIWNSHGGNPYATRAVFVNRRNDPSKTMYLIYLDGKHIDPPIPVEHDSFNQNPGNDQQFMRRLPDWLDKVAGKEPPKPEPAPEPPRPRPKAKRTRAPRQMSFKF